MAQGKQNRIVPNLALGNALGPGKLRLPRRGLGRLFGCLLFLSLCTGCSHAPSGAGGISLDPVKALVVFYREGLNHMDAVRTSECPMHPSCSSYSLQALKKHGPLIGWIMTCDRLLRCGEDELDLCRKIWVNGKIRCYDPVKGNDFWWFDEH